MRIKKRYIAALAIGAIIIIGLLSEADLSRIAKAVHNVGWAGYLVLLAVNFPTLLFSGLTWKLIFETRAGRKFPFAELVKIKQACNSLNAMTPGFIMGEPVRIYLTKSGSGVEASAASVILDRYLEMVGYFLFIVSAIAAGFSSKVIPARLEGLAIGGIFLTALILFVLGRALMGGTPGFFSGRGRMGVVERLIGKNEAALKRTQAVMADFYDKHKATLLTVIVINGIKMSWVAFFLHVALTLMGEPSSILNASLFVGLGSLISLIPIPESIGTEEAAFSALAALMSLKPEAGIALALLHKAVRWVWIVLGLWIGAKRGWERVTGKVDPGLEMP